MGELRWLYHTGFPGRASGGIPRQADVDGLNSERIVVGLADSWIRLESARLMAMHAAALYDHRQNCGIQAAAAKYLGAEAGFDACDRAMSTHGGYAYAKEFHVERLWREARLLRNAPFSQEMILTYISTQALNLPRAY